MKGIVIVLLSLIAFTVCQAPANLPACADATVTKLPNPSVDDGSWSETYTLNSATDNTTTTCFSVPWAANGTLVIAARLTEEGSNTTLSVYAYKAATVPTTVDVVDEDDVDSVCVSDNSTYVSPTTSTVYFYVTGPNGTEYQLWDDFSTDENPPCGADVTVSGSSNFWIWIIVAVVIVIAIAVIIAGAGAFVYYQKKKKGQAKLYEDS